MAGEKSEHVVEIKVGCLFEFFPKRRLGLLKLHSVPTHVRDFDAGTGEAFDVAFEDGESFGAGAFLAALEEELEADADTEVGLAGFDPFAERVGEAKAIEAVHAVAEGALAGEDEVGEFLQLLGRSDQGGIVPESPAGVYDTAEVAPPVVDHSKFHGLRGLPWSKGFPSCADRFRQRCAGRGPSI